MKKLALISFWLIISNSVLFAQHEVIEIKKPKISAIYTAMKMKVNELGNDETNKAISLLNAALKEIKNPYERFNIIYWNLSMLYANSGDYKNCLNILVSGQKEGLYFPIRMQRNSPTYIVQLKELDGFNKFIETNNQLKTEAQTKSVPEYIIELPKGYSEEKSYPLFLTFTGGWGSHISLSNNWHSPKLEQEYIVAHLQGSVCHASFLKSYNRQKLDELTAIYKNILKDYAIDTSNIILGAQSAGTYYTLKLTVDNLIPAKGIILAFPHIPRNLDFLKYEVLADKDVALSVMGGELDFRRIAKMKEMSVNFDKSGIRNRFIIFSEKGHEFPDDFGHQLDLSIDFICTPLSNK